MRPRRRSSKRSSRRLRSRSSGAAGPPPATVAGISSSGRCSPVAGCSPPATTVTSRHSIRSPASSSGRPIPASPCPEAPARDPGLLVVGSSGGDVVALSGADGSVTWRARVTSEVLSAPAVGERIVAVRTVDGKLFGLDAATGERTWVYDRTVPVLTLRGTGGPVITGDIVVAGFDSGHLAAFSTADGQLLWESHVAAPTGQTELERLADLDADPVVADGVVYAVTFQGRVTAFDLRTGGPLWQRDLSSHAGIGNRPAADLRHRRAEPRLGVRPSHRRIAVAAGRARAATVDPADRVRGLRRRRGLRGACALAQRRRRPLSPPGPASAAPRCSLPRWPIRLPCTSSAGTGRSLPSPFPDRRRRVDVSGRRTGPRGGAGPTPRT